jgi:uncharacterized protein YukE
MKFDMGTQALTNLMSGSRNSSTDLGTLIKALVNAAQPLEGKFQGQGKVAFDSFKTRADGITKELNAALAAILGGQSGMEKAFASGDTEHGENAKTQMSAGNFDAARFAGR